MAGMLPGVECARRRRFHQSITSSDSPSTAAKLGSTRRSSFCLYTSNRDFHHTSSSSQQRSTSNQANYQNDKLGEIAREAKERLDERLRIHRKPETIRKNVEETSLKSSEKHGKGKGKEEGKKTEEKLGGKKSGGKRFNWAKLSWKGSEQEECAVCLEEFKAGEGLVHLPCAHKFHSRCLVPWLENNGHCPCCRMGIAS